MDFAPLAAHESHHSEASSTRPVTIVGQLNDWRSHLRWGVSLPGAILALLCYATAWTPSLLPRSWYFQGIIGAVSAVFGYAIGIALGWLIAATCEWASLRLALNARALRALRWVGWVYVALTTLAFPLWSLRWQRATARMVDARPPGILEVIGGTLVAIAVFWLFVAMWRGIVKLINVTSRRLTSRIHERTAKITATILVFVLIVVGIDQGLVRGVMAAASWGSDLFDSQTPRGVGQPSSPLRSGSPASSITWDSLAREGKVFVSHGPDAARIREVTGRDATEPIRVYSSLNDTSMDGAVDRILTELDRTRAWERKAILINTSTGRGNVNEWSTTAFEYLMGGDCAAVSMQYSSMPSAFLLFGHQELPVQASTKLIHAILDRVRQLPTESRPKIYLSAESLGAYGSNEAFDGASDLLAGVDGAMWMGTPAFTRIRSEFTDRRSAGSTPMNPVIDDGRQVRFAGDAAELATDQFGRALAPWEKPRILYLQHPSDPVVWWDTSLLWRNPTWLQEPRQGPAALMSWYPFITFWQVTMDMAVSRDVPGGFGHNYHASDVVPAWAGVLDADPALVGPVTQAVLDDVGP